MRFFSKEPTLMELVTCKSGTDQALFREKMGARAPLKPSVTRHLSVAVGSFLLGDKDSSIRRGKMLQKTPILSFELEGAVGSLLLGRGFGGRATNMSDQLIGWSWIEGKKE